MRRPRRIAARGAGPTAAAAANAALIAVGVRSVLAAMPSLTPARGAAAALLTARIAYGAGLLTVPAKLASGRWLGPGAKTPAATVALRGFGARETLLHVGALAATLSGKPIRPWLAASIVGDLVDVAATAGERNGLPDGAAPATAAVAGGSALMSALVAVWTAE